jgi:hypothetical protein
VFFTDTGKLYRVYKRMCGPGARPCKTFWDIGAFELRSTSDIARPEDPKNPNSGIDLPEGSTTWPFEIPVRLADVPAEGLKISKTEFEAHRDVYFQLLKGGIYSGPPGITVIDDGYMYRRVRICPVDPQAPPEECLHPDLSVH